jgi:hypothetical protein
MGALDPSRTVGHKVSAFGGAAGMRRFVIAAFALGLIAAISLVLGRAAPVDNENAAKEADRIFVNYLGKADQKRIAGMLDRRFAWIDNNGRNRNRRETLKAFASLAATATPDRDIESQFYGRMFAARGNHDNARFLRIFVKRHHGWKAVLVMEAPVVETAVAAPVERSANAGACDNPCRTVPYAPKRQIDKDILAAWQAGKVQEWNETGVPADAVSSMRIFDFGIKSALMISQQIPYRGGKPYMDVRVWLRGAQGWQTALSQQVTIQAAPATPALASKQ